MKTKRTNHWATIKISGLVLTLVLVAGCSSSSFQAAPAPLTLEPVPASSTTDEAPVTGYSLAAGDALGEAIFSVPAGNTGQRIARND